MYPHIHTILNSRHDTRIILLASSFSMHSNMFTNHSVPLFCPPGTWGVVLDVVLSFEIFCIRRYWPLFRRFYKPTFGDKFQLFLKAHRTASRPAFYSLFMLSLLASFSWWGAWAVSGRRSCRARAVNRHARVFNKKVFHGISFEVRPRNVACIEARWRGDIPAFFDAFWDRNSIFFTLNLVWNWKKMILNSPNFSTYEFGIWSDEIREWCNGGETMQCQGRRTVTTKYNIRENIF